MFAANMVASDKKARESYSEPNGPNHDTSTDRDDFVKGVICFIMGGSACFDHMHKMGFVMSSQSVRQKIKLHFRASEGIIFDVCGLNPSNVTKRFKHILECDGVKLKPYGEEKSNACDDDIDAFKIIGKGVIVNVKSDEMYHAKKLEVSFDPETQRNMIIGRGAEHYSSLKHTEYVQNETDCRLVISQLNDEDDAIGISQLLNVVQVTIQKCGESQSKTEGNDDNNNEPKQKKQKRNGKQRRK
eukprot:713687_1